MPLAAPKPRHTLALLLPAFLLLIATACNSPSATTSPEPAATQPEVIPYQKEAAGSREQRGDSLDENVRFERFSLDQGLSQSVVTSILQDSRGFIWFGTQDGLNRFDGYEFVVYKHDPEDPGSLSHNFVQGIVEDASGALWIGTNGGGLDRLDPETGRFTHHQHDPDDPDSLSHNVILALHQDGQGVLWIGTNGGGLDRLDPASTAEAGAGRFVHYQYDPDDPHSLSNNSVPSIYQDREGVLWVGTNGGLNRLDPNSKPEPGAGQFTRYQHDPGDPGSLNHDAIQAIYQDREGMLWIGTNGGGLDRFVPEGAAEPDAGRFVHYQHDPDDPHSLSNDQVWAIREDGAGVLWIGTFGGGLDRYDPGQDRFVHLQNDPADPGSLGNNQIWTIYEDPTGALWIGTFGGGANRFDREKNKFALYRANPNDPNSLSENVVWSILEEQEGTLWIGTNGGGLNRLDRDRTQFIHYRNVPTDTHSLGHDVVWSLLQDLDGTLWVGTHTGLNRFDGDQFVRYPSPPVFTIYQDRAGQIWIGTWGGGLGRFDAGTEQFTFYQNDPDDPGSLSDNSVLAIYEDGAGSFWIGTFNGGLNRLEREGAPETGTARFTHYQNDPDDPRSLSQNTVLAIHEDGNGILWLATAGGGLNRLDPTTMTFTHWTEKDGLPNDTIYGILEDDILPEEGGPNLWLSTNRGVSRFSPQDSTFRNYDVDDGLQSSEFNQGAFHKGPDGEMFFGGVNGFNAFYPEQVTDNPHIPPIMLTALTQGGEELAAGQTVESLSEVTLHWPRNFFEFEFAALDYAQPEENQYAYMLEGFDSAWIEAGTKRFGRYTNLPGGTYTLRLRGSNNDGVWNENGHSLAITVVPPAWDTWWFRGGAALMLLVGAFAVYRLRVRGIEARSRELETQVAARTKDLAALNTVSAAVSRSLDLQEILGDTLDATLEITGTEGGGVYLLDKQASVLTLAAHRGFSPEFASNIDRLAVGEGFSGYVVQSGQPLVVEDISTDARLTRMIAREEGFHSLICVPLAAKGEVLGTLFAMTREFREFTEQDTRLLSSITDQIAVAVQNVRLFEDARARLAQLKALQETSRLVASTLELDRLLSLIIEQAATLLQADGGFINLVDWDRQEDEVVAASGSMASFLGQRSALEGSLSGWVTLNNEPVLSNEIRADDRVSQSALEPVEEMQLKCAALAPLVIKDQVMGTLVVLGRRGGKEEFTQNDLHLLVSFANQAATALENAKLLRAERQRADELEALRTTMADITTELDLPALLEAIVERAAILLDATGGEFGLYDEASQELQIVVSYNLGQDYVGTRHRLGEGAMGRVAETGESLIIPDYQTWAGGLTAYSHVHATLATPLKVGNRLVGVFTTISTDPERQFTGADLHLLNLFAQQAAIAIENARLYQRAQQLAVMEERQRLARDLHDSVTQALYGITLYSEAAAEELSLQQLDLVAEYLGELQHTSQEALAEMRLLIHELRPSILEEEGLAATLQTRLLAVEGRAGLKTQFTVDLEGRLPPDVEEGLYRIAREALNNALKHAQASTISVDLRRGPDDGKVSLEVADDGIGFDADAGRQKGGLGLSAMEERATELGGQLTIESKPGSGSRILVEVSI